MVITSSTKIRVTVIPKSNDVVPVRNQLLEIDLVNSTISGIVLMPNKTYNW